MGAAEPKSGELHGVIGAALGVPRPSAWERFS